MEKEITPKTNRVNFLQEGLCFISKISFKMVKKSYEINGYLKNP